MTAARATTWVVAVVLLAGPGCGPVEPSAPGFDLELAVQRGLLDTISAFQVSVVTSGSTIGDGDCTTIRKTCIKGQVPDGRFVQLRNAAANRTQSALVFPVMLVAGRPTTQSLTLTEVTPGRDYALIVEAIAKDGVRLAGADCQFIPQLSAGPNNRVTLKLQTYDPPKSCDPRLVP